MAKQLFVFDLDFTIWDAGGVWCDCTFPPYKRKNGSIMDSLGAVIKLYPDVLNILHKLYSLQKIIAIASRTSEPSYAKELLLLFKIQSFFHYAEIYPTNKTKHLHKISHDSGIAFSEIVFFDDESRNIHDIREIGIESILVKKGITTSLIEKHL